MALMLMCHAIICALSPPPPDTHTHTHTLIHIHTRMCICTNIYQRYSSNSEDNTITGHAMKVLRRSSNIDHGDDLSASRAGCITLGENVPSSH